MSARIDDRVLVLSPTAGDAALSQSILTSAGLACRICAGIDDFCSEFLAGCGTLLLTEDGLVSDESHRLAQVLNQQESWSDIPILMLCGSGADSLVAVAAMELLGNVTILEQPVRVTTLISALRTALKARQRQYEIRNQVESLRYQLDLTRTITHNAMTAIFMMDSNSRCTFMNPAAEDMIGLTFEEARGQSLRELIQYRSAAGSANSPAEWILDSDLVLRDSIVGHEGLFRRKNGDCFPVLCNAKPILKDGIAVGTVIEVRDITERKKAQQREHELLVETARANARFQAFFEQGAVFAGILDLDGVMVEANRLCLESCGYTKANVVGKLFWDCPWWAQSQSLSERIHAAVKQVVNGTVFRSEMPYFVADGTEKVIDLIILPIRDEQGKILFLAPTGTDITDRKRAETAMLMRSQQLRRLSQVATELNVAHDVSSVMQIMTEAAREVVDSHQAVASMTHDECAGQSLTSVSLSHKYAEWRGYDREPDGSGIYSLVCRLNKPMRLTQDELEKHPAWKAFGSENANHPPMRGWLAAPFVGRDGRNLGLLQLSDKVSGEYTDEDESVLVQLAQMASVAIENARLVGSLRDADRRKDEFLATLAHELRNPLAPIRTGLELLRLCAGDRLLVEEIRTTMEGQTRQLVRLVDDLLDISRITSGKVTLRREVVDLSLVVRSAVDASQSAMEEAGHQLRVTMPTDPVYLNGDPTRLVQILSNLLTNAARYTERQGRIRLAVEKSSGNVRVTVKDSGIGIPGEMLERIFDMFMQVNQTLERSHGGLGIGLTLVKRLVEMHGGTVEAKSEGPGMGSQFTVQLPLSEPTQEEPTMLDDSPNPVTQRRVLVVDDNKDAAKMLGMVVRMLGNEVRTAGDGQEALEVAAEFLPELVIMDIGMPVMNGYEAAKIFRQKPWGQSMVIVALTGWGQDEDRNRTREAGFDHHLVKPVEPAALQKLLDGHRTISRPTEVPSPLRPLA